MKLTNRIIILVSLILSMIAALYVTGCTGLWISLNVFDGGFSRTISYPEKQLRKDTVATAQQWLDVMEGSDKHLEILSIYNSHEPLARGYEVTANDNWCAAFGSCVSIQLSLTDIVPTECGCERQIELWKELGHWTEYDNHMPQPGDFIYYNWNDRFSLKENTGWADHVGIVVGTAGPLIKVIEGNKNDCVTYRIIFRGDYRIRGYGLPDYASRIS